MNEKKILFNEPFLSGKEKSYIDEVFDNNIFDGNGPFSKRAQQFLKEHLSSARVLLTHSCTAALEITGLLARLGPGDEVLLPSYTFVSTATAFLRTGAKLVFCEIDPNTMNIDAEDIAQKLNKRTKAIIAMHYAGIAANLEEITALARDHNVLIIEDAAQGLGAEWNNKSLGTIAPLGCLSFHQTKNIHCGLGGALLINNEEFFSRAEYIWERGTNRGDMTKGLSKKYSWVEMGSSYYLTEFQAAFLLAQLESLDENTKTRKHIFELYQSELSILEREGRFRLPTIGENRKSNYHCFYLICNSIDDREKLINYLNERNIQAQIHYVPLHSSKMGVSLGLDKDDLPLTEEYAQRILRLPLHNNLSEEDVLKVCEETNSFFRR